MKPEADGFITIHRKIRNHPYWEDPERLRAWLDILLMAAWKDHKRMIGVHQVDVKRGEFIASIRFLAKRWRWSNGKVERYLKAAQDMNEIRVVNETSNGYRYLVVKYDSYQKQRDTYKDTIEYSNGTPSSTATGQREQREQREQGEQGKEQVLSEPKRKSEVLVLDPPLTPPLVPGNLVQERVDQVRGATSKKKDRDAKIVVFIEIIFLYWREMMSKTGRTVLDAKRSRRLRDRLLENDSDVAELLCTVDGALKDDFLMGTSDRSDGRAYNGIEVVFRDRGQVERLAPQSKYYGREVHPFMQDRSES